MGNVGGAYGWGRGVSVCLSVLYMLEWGGVTYRESERDLGPGFGVVFF
jgi:hypothetical protein